LRWLALLPLLILTACATPHMQEALMPDGTPQPRFEPELSTFTSFDGAELGLTVWQADAGVEGAGAEHVILGVHGMNDYANAFHMVAPWFAERGVTTYAYDQRGFGRSVERGIWPEPDLMREDIRVAIDLVRARHPDATLTLIGISMGGSAAMTLFGSDNPPEGVDRLILSGPGLRGWGAMNWLYRGALWLSAHTRPGWVVRPPRGVKIEPSDNVEMLRRMMEDPLRMTDNRIDQVYGVVALMEAAHEAAPKLPESLPTLMTYGARDIVVPPGGVRRTLKILAPHVRTAYYPKGYHMLLRDLQAETVYADMWAFMQDPSAPLPSGVSSIPAK
jgi:alpha-beta hydrolase superfamily lysophospholipase|tara:strand:- start:341 stop:1336 length:996 start_codon:yes stop_codon:yes gene_type:complete